MANYITVLLITCFSLFLVGCGETRQTQPEHQTTTQGQSETPSKMTSTAVPSNKITYSVISERKVLGIKRSLEIRLSEKVSERVLKAIALKLSSKDSQDYERTFIVYYLPGMTVGSGAWATTHFNPNLEVKILGVSIEAEAKMSKRQLATGQELVGVWLDETPYSGGRISIYRQGNKLFMDRVFQDGSKMSTELIERKSSQGRRFNSAEGSGYGDYWVIDTSGNLQIRDGEGLISVAGKVK